MFRRCLFVLAIAIAACSTVETPTAPASTAADPLSPAAEWRERMTDVGRQCKSIKRMLVDGEATDLRAVAESATAMAATLRLGYGRLEDQTVPDFARMAHDAESWLLQVALEARQAHGDIARELFAAGRPHCVRCHEADERVHGALRSGG
jgi:hypothetical protein